MRTNLKGIVIKEIHTGESDKIIVLFTHETGKISLIARGAKRTNSRLLAGSQLMSYGEYTIFPSRKLPSINTVVVLETFYHLRSDLIKLTYATYFLELVDEVLLEGIKNDPLLRLLLNTLYILANKDKDPKLIARIFELKMMCMVGYMPMIHQCVHCGGDFQDSNVKFSITLGGALCYRCFSEDPFSHSISRGTLQSLQYIVYSELKQMFNFTVSEQTIAELTRLMKSYLKYHLDKEFKSLEFLELLES